MPRHEDGFYSHLEEFRRRLVVSLLFFAAASAGAYFFSQQILDFLIEPLRAHQEVDLYFHKPYEAFLTHLKVAALSGVILASPVLITQLWFFVAPGLYESEKKTAVPLIAVSVLMFLAGAAFAYWAVIPFGLHFLLSFETESLKPLLGVGPYFSFLIGMILAFGVVFDFPILLVGLVRLELVSAFALKKARKAVVLGIFIAAAVLTPPDPLSQLLLAVPLLALFEISLLIARRIEQKRR